MDEFSIIEYIKKQLPTPQKDVVVGIGDDAAVIKKNRNEYTLATCDSLVENVHFVKKEITFSTLGQRAVAVNVSDIAAMGGIPNHMLVSFIIPKKTSSSFISDFYRGIAIACKKYGIDVVGGNISSGPVLIIDLTLLGQVKKNNLLLRSGAKVGDLVLVTGILGSDPKIPVARLEESQILAISKKVTSMIDISDGLSSDIQHICAQSNVGVRLYAKNLPIFQTSTRGVGAQKKYSNWETALNKGENYELCFTTSSKNALPLKKLVEQQTKTPITIIGEITKSNRLLVLPNNTEVPLQAKGWNHFL